MTTLLALYRRPDGGPEAPGDVRAALRGGAPAARRRRRRACASTRVQPRDRGAPRRPRRIYPRHVDGLRRPGGARRRRSRPTRCAPRPQPARDRARAWPRCSSSRTCPNWTPRLPRPWILSGRQPRSVRDRYRVVERPADGEARPAQARPRRVPGAGAGRRRRPRRRLAGRRARDPRPARGAQRAELRPARRARRRRSRRSTPTRPAGPIVITGAGDAGLRRRRRHPRARAPDLRFADGGRAVRGVGPAGGGRRCRSSPRSAASRSAAAASWRWPAT